jgi:Tol biopolymer transport system component
VTVIPRVERTSLGAAPVALSRDGTLAHLSGPRLSVPVLVDRRGARRLLPLPARPYANPRFSPDGTRIAFGLDDGSNMLDGSVWIYDVASATLTRLPGADGATRPEWSPYARRVLYVRPDSSRHISLWWQPADGSGPASRLFSAGDDILEGVLAPDGRTLVYRTRGPRGARDILAVPLAAGDGTGAAAPRPLVVGPGGAVTPRVSPDGRWLAYASDESGTLQVYVRAFPGPGGRTQVSVNEGTEPVWSRDGRHLFYRDGRRIVDATVRATTAFAVVARDLFAEGDYDANWAHANYDVAPDGARMLMLERAGAPQQIVVVHRWVRELLAATGRP